MMAPALGTGSLTGETSSFPMVERAEEIVYANPTSAIGARTCTPLSNSPATIVDALLSATMMPAARRADMICPAKAEPSPSVPYEFTKTAWPLNLRQASAISRCWSRVRLLGATIASSFNRSNRSASAFLFASAARAVASAIRASAVDTFATASRDAAFADATWASAPFARALASAIWRSKPLAVASAWVARTFRLPTSRSEIVCKWDEQRNIPPSANNSPATPIITNISNTFTYFFQRSASLYSPISPRVSSTPNSSSAISEILRPTEVADFDSEKKVPISLYELAGALGFALQGLCFACLLYHRLNRRHKKTVNSQNNA